ncbi:molybdenum ABC transporter, periplasmic molybdate-binding protein [Thermanaerovibrio velox DSM 12556]|uniref:Molybdenum ABC transporter, periplasmic molybdate-binding protein n=1 Tax=Thermanaerovibrio velox DSM 12556 TaxID=926567 RepID=H0UNG9_9BACT|nr:molybdate ABC transporter substrate-binding protein [Thermanaerovibrio velox]EHM09376.1 molybdenum ABC transporter, periplasmic molybdate-binding protein [Thermanaerovibrio velox DSM 12556]
MFKGAFRFLSRAVLVAAFLSLSPSVSLGAGGGDLMVAVVFGFKPPMERIVEKYNESGVKLSVSYGTSGEIARQISMGAPYQVFICSDRRWEDFVKSKGLVKHGFEIASNPVVLWTPKGKKPLELKDLPNSKIAIPDPNTAAYGIKAREYLEKVGLWNSMVSKGMVIMGGGPQRAALVAKTGMADGAIIGCSVAKDMKEGSFVEVPVKAPVFTVLVLKGASREAEALAEFLRSRDSVKGILEDCGFIPLR